MASITSLTKITTSTSKFILKLLLCPIPTRSTLARAIHSKPTAEVGADHLRDTFQSFKFAKHPCLVAGPVRSCDLKEDNDAVYVRLDMPGIAEEGLKVWIVKDSLCISGEENEDGDERKYTTSLAIAPGCYNTDQIKTVLKDGVLRVVVPKIKGWDQSEVVNVNVSDTEF